MSLTFKVPTTTLPDGRLFISDETMREHPEVLEFVQRFPDYWIRDCDRDGVVSAKVVMLPAFGR